MSICLGIALFCWANAEEKKRSKPVLYSAQENTGAICLGPDLSMAGVYSDIFIKIDSGEKKLFSGAEGQIPFTGLNLKKKHAVKLFKGTEQFSSFSISFEKPKSNFLIIWKSPGSWRAMPVGGEECTWPVPSCPKGSGCP